MILRLTLNSSINSNIQENSLKVLVKWYFTPERLHCFKSTLSNVWWRCEKDKGNMIHAFWICEEIMPFWNKVKEITQKCTDIHVSNNREFFSPRT